MVKKVSKSGVLSKKSAPVYGGQAIIEGVMFKSASALSLAVRLPNGKIHSEAKPYESVTRHYGLHRVPFIRGIAVFIEMLFIGISYLNKSATLALDEDEKSNKKGEEKNSDSIWMTLALILSFVLSTIVALAAFKLLPLGVTSLIWNKATTVPIVFTLTEGLIKITVFLIYLYVIGKMKDVARVFQYHGAEHKVIRAFEAGKKLTVDNVRLATRYHPRCGTSFVVFVIMISILLYSLVPLAFAIWQLLLIRIALLPVLAGISYEVLTLTARVSEDSKWSFVLKPGYFVQSLTTREPDKKQIEVAIAAFNACKSKTK